MAIPSYGIIQCANMLGDIIFLKWQKKCIYSQLILRDTSFTISTFSN